MPAPEPPLVTLKKRKIPVWQRLLAWYLKLRLLNKVALWLLFASIPTAAIGYKVLRPAYREWKQRNALVLAANCIEKKDDKGAVLAFRRAILANPKNPLVWERLGTYLQSKGSPEVLWVWDRLVMVQPTTENRLRLARAALAAGDWQRARNSLESVPESDRKSRDYLLLSAQAFAAAGQSARAEALMDDLFQREPDNLEVAFQLDQIRMSSSDPSVQANAQVRMRALADGKGPQSTAALRLLTLVELRAGQKILAASDAGELVQRPDAGVNDHLLFLDLEFVTQSFSLPLSIQKSRELAMTNPENLRPIMTYLIRRGLAAETLTWLEKQPAEKLADPALLPAYVDLAIAARDWEKAYTLLGRTDPPVPTEQLAKIRSVQQAFRADQSDALVKWGELASEARTNIYLLGTMEQLASTWGWPQGREKVLWIIAEVVPANVLVWKELLPIALQNGNTPATLRILTALTALDPSNQQLRSTLLRLQFLLQRGETKDLLRMAEADAKVSSTPEVQVIYAALLANAGKIDEAVAVSEKLPSAARTNPRLAAYLAFVYAKAKKPEVVRQLLTLIHANEKELLGEEVSLARRALAIAEERPEDKISAAASKTMDAEVARRVLHDLEGARSEPGADRQRLLEQLKSQGAGAGGTNEQLKRLRLEIQKDAKPAPTPAKP